MEMPQRKTEKLKNTEQNQSEALEWNGTREKREENRENRGAKNQTHRAHIIFSSFKCSCSTIVGHLCWQCVNGHLRVETFKNISAKAEKKTAGTFASGKTKPKWEKTKAETQNQPRFMDLTWQRVSFGTVTGTGNGFI